MQSHVEDVEEAKPQTAIDIRWIGESYIALLKHAKSFE